MNLNKVFLLGRLTADPQLRTTPAGHQVATFSIATNRVWNDKAGSKREEVEFHNIVVWGRQADVVSRFLNKGGLVLVEGRLQTRSWDDKQGQKRKTTEIVSDRIQLGPRSFSGPPSPSFVQPVKTEELPTINLEEPLTDSLSADRHESGEINPENIPF